MKNSASALHNSRSYKHKDLQSFISFNAFDFQKIGKNVSSLKV